MTWARVSVRWVRRHYHFVSGRSIAATRSESFETTSETDLLKVDEVEVQGDGDIETIDSDIDAIDDEPFTVTVVGFTDTDDRSRTPTRLIPALPAEESSASLALPFPPFPPPRVDSDIDHRR